MPGVISHATNVAEYPELVSSASSGSAQLVGRENIIAGTDRGFAQGSFYRCVHPSIMWAIFEALVEGVRLAVRELWA
jgi:5-methyltetrahydropteroyltriglutamate--homocysteine methyltransferase